MMAKETGPDVAEDTCASLSETRGNLGPTIHQVIECRPPEWIPFIAVGLAGLLIIVILTIKGCRQFFSVLWSHSTIVSKTRAVFLYYLLYGLVNFLKILNPNSLEVYDIVGTILEGLLVYFVYSLLWDYAGGYENVLPSVLGRQITINGRPMCCLKCTRKVTLNFIWIYEWLVMQYPIVQLLLGVIETSSFFDGHQGISKKVIRGLRALSMFAALYGIEVVQKLWKGQKGLDPKIRKKIALLKLTIILARVQGFIFTITGFSVEHIGAMTGSYRAATWNSFIKLVECVFFSFFANRLYTLEDITAREEEQQLSSGISVDKEDDVEDSNDDVIKCTDNRRGGGMNGEADLALDMSYDVTDVQYKDEKETLISDLTKSG